MSDAFQLEELDGQIALLTFNVPEKKVNTLSQSVLAELGKWVGKLADRRDLRGLLLRSGKPGQFIAGADLKELAALAYASKEQVGQAIAFGHQLYSSFARLSFPTVALIDGNCMGGGTELVLAFDDRIASSSPETKIQLPEVNLGLLPAWGGTQRLPRLIGLNAIEVICGGQPLNAKRAAELGVVFDAVPADRLLDEGRRLIEYFQESGEWKKRRERAAQPLGLSPDQMAFAFATAEGLLRSKTKGQYPAPLAALKAIKDGCNLPLEQGLEAEKQVALELFGSPIAANLIGIFFMKNRLAHDPGVDRAEVKPGRVDRAGVVGSGLMGAGIATALARSGIPTAMVDVDNSRLAAGLKQAEEVVLSRIKIGRAAPMDMADMLAHLSTSTGHGILTDSDLIIEAITENEDAKTATYKQLSQVMKPGAILASNTSTISITRMAAAAPDASRFLGMHFFSPVDRMELVEVIRGEATSDETVATVVALAKRIRKTPIVVRDCPGFLVNRVLFPYMNEALVLLQDGVPMDEIDAAATAFGMPMGPIALQDLVGLDTSLYAGKVLADAYSDRTMLPLLLKDLVKAGRLGKKSGAGFRIHGAGGKASKPAADPTFATFLEPHRGPAGKVGSLNRQEITDRLFLPMLLEATRVLEEEIVREPADVDMGLILGIGFPPFRGGILRWCDAEGAAKILEKLAQYAPLGKRYEPTETLTRHAQTGATFYPVPKGISMANATSA